MDAQPVGLREAARLMSESGHKITHSTLSRQIASGAIPNRGTLQRPLVLVPEAIAARAANVNGLMRRDPAGSGEPGGLDFEGGTAASAAPAAPDAPPAPRAPTMNTARTASEAIKAQLLKIDLEQKRGTLLDKAQVQEAFFSLGIHLREMLEQRRHALAQSLLGLASVGEVGAALATADDRLLQALHDNMAQALDLSPPPRESADDAQ